MKIKKLMLYVILIGGFLSCNTNKKRITITDFSKSFSDTLYPNENSTYAMMNIWVRGFVNDTIQIRLYSKDSEPILKLKGEINERWYTDYYGGGERIVIFEPYKATEGKLEIKYGLY
ncbi:hypothetical protein JYU05_00995 [bacterium AH-315-P13]|nr:hypothetical protein [bacterium AH-315-P13]